MEMVVSIIIVLALINVYFLPTHIAYARRHHNTWPILATNLLLGWLVTGWVVALIWSLTSSPESGTAPPPST